MTDRDAIERDKAWSPREDSYRKGTWEKRDEDEQRRNLGQSKCVPESLRKIYFRMTYIYKYLLSLFQLPVTFLTSFTQQGTKIHIFKSPGMCSLKNFILLVYRNKSWSLYSDPDFI